MLPVHLAMSLLQHVCVGVVVVVEVKNVLKFWLDVVEVLYYSFVGKHIG